MKLKNKLLTTLLISCFAITPTTHPFMDTLNNIPIQDKVAIAAALVINGVLIPKIAMQEQTIDQAWEDKDWKLITLIVADSILAGYAAGRLASMGQTSTPVKAKPIPKVYSRNDDPYYKSTVTTGKKGKKKKKKKGMRRKYKKKTNLKNRVIGSIKKKRGHMDKDLEATF